MPQTIISALGTKFTARTKNTLDVLVEKELKTQMKQENLQQEEPMKQHSKGQIMQNLMKKNFNYVINSFYELNQREKEREEAARCEIKKTIE